MPESELKYLPIPPDNLSRTFAFANPHEDGELPHIGR